MSIKIFVGKDYDGKKAQNFWMRVCLKKPFGDQENATFYNFSHHVNHCVKNIFINF
jgi:hypothetical protein